MRMAKWLVPLVVSERKSTASEVSVRFTLVKGSEVELLFIVFQILKFDIALKKKKVCCLVASFAISGFDQQTVGASYYPKVRKGWGLSQIVPRLGKHFLYFSKHLVFSLLIKFLGQRDGRML